MPGSLLCRSKYSLQELGKEEKGRGVTSVNRKKDPVGLEVILESKKEVSEGGGTNSCSLMLGEKKQTREGKRLI